MKEVIKMNEFLDYYDEDGNFLGTATRDEVHEKGLWHNTVHCWLYTKDGKLMFQIRASRGTFYTTASGHVMAGETISEAFHREIKEEIGLELDTINATFVNIVPWKMDKIKNNKLIKDRAKANVYINLYDGDLKDFHFNPDEVLGIGIVDTKEVLQLFNDKVQAIKATIVENDKIYDKMVTKEDFLVQEHETLIEKYGSIINKVIEVTK